MLGEQGGDPQPGLCGGCERGEGPCAPAGSALGTAALRRCRPPRSSSLRRCCPLCTWADRACPPRLAKRLLGRGELCSEPGTSPRAGEKGQCGGKHGLCLLHTDVEEPVKKLPHRSVFQQRQSCGTRAPLQFADKDEAAC